MKDPITRGVLDVAATQAATTMVHVPRDRGRSGAAIVPWEAKGTSPVDRKEWESDEEQEESSGAAGRDPAGPRATGEQRSPRSGRAAGSTAPRRAAVGTHRRTDGQRSAWRQAARSSAGLRADGRAAVSSAEQA